GQVFAGADTQRFDLRHEGHAAGRIGRCLHLDAGAVLRGGDLPEALVDRVDDVGGGLEVGTAQAEHHRGARGEVGGDFALDGRAVGDAAGGGRVDGDARAAVALG